MRRLPTGFQGRWFVYRLLLVGAIVVKGATVGAAADGHRLIREKLEVEIECDTPRLVAEFGPRFDQTAMVTEVTLAGRPFVSPRGLPDEYGLDGVGVLGFDEAPAGGEFIKIGVGVLRREGAEKYRFQSDYPVVQRFRVAVEADREHVAVSQESSDLRGYRYRYEKRYALEAGDALRIDYLLTNIGSRAFSIETYNHNFFAFGDAVTHRDYVVTPTFPLPSAPVGAWTLEGDALRLKSDSLPAQGAYWGGNVAVEAGQHVVVLGIQGHQRVEVSGDTSVVRFAVWADARSICPELFVRQRLDPGATVRWTRRYRFSGT